VRHIRMLGMCLVAVLVLAATAATSALAKDPFKANRWNQYAHCPYNSPQLVQPHEENSNPFCFLGRTAGGSKGGFFSLGGVMVRLNKPIVLQGAAYNSSYVEKQAIEQERKECEASPGSKPECKAAEEAKEGFNIYWQYRNAALKIIGPEDGAETLESPEFKVTKGLKTITSTIEEEAEWPQALKESLNEALKNKEGGLNVKIELAGNSLYETWGALSTERLLFEQGSAFKLPLKVKVTGPWLEKAGGGPCLIGNDAHPIVQDLSTESPGRATEPGGFVWDELPEEEFFEDELRGSILTDLKWSVPAGAGASGCGGAYESYVDTAIDDLLELEYGQHGTTILSGDLFNGPTTVVKERAEEGRV
jgi:hypothetical protein